MADASIPVDLFNAGQVFACLGFLEAADQLCGNAEGGFDWTEETDVRFRLRASGEDNPFAVVLGFLAEAALRSRVPRGYESPAQDVLPMDGFPSGTPEKMALPIRLGGNGTRWIDVGHWADGSSREDFKLYSGNRSAAGIANAMLVGDSKKKTKGLAPLWQELRDELTTSPLDFVTPMGGSFNLDPRGAWTAISAGYSLNEHKGIQVASSPVVEILAAVGLEHARPERRQAEVRYSAWGGVLPPLLARPALGCAETAVPLRKFRFSLEHKGKNRAITFAQEETTR